MIISRLSYLALALACVLRWAACVSSAFAYQTLVNDTRRVKQRGSEKNDRNQIDSEVNYNYELEVHFVHGNGAYDSALVMTDVLRLLSKPQAFSGEENDWKNWRFSFMAYVGAVAKAMATETMTAMKKTDPVAMKDLSGDEQKRSATMILLVGAAVEEACAYAVADRRGQQRL